MIGAERGAAVVCIPVGGADERLERTLRSVLAHTDATVGLVVYDNAGASEAAGDLVKSCRQDPAREVVYLSPDAAFDTVTSRAAPADVVLVEPGCAVVAGWLTGLRRAAYSDAGVATATALTRDDIAPRIDQPIDHAAATLYGRPSAVRPRLSAPRGPCVYVRRSALELLADLGPASVRDFPTDPAFGRWCVASGLWHVLADDVLIDATRPFPPRTPGDDGGPLERSLAGARRAMRGLSAIIDARILYGPVTGTQVHVLELIAGLARTEKVRLTAIVPDHPNQDALQRLESLGAVSVVTPEQASRASTPIVDVVHRPFQLTNAGDLTFLESLGDRLVLTQEDLIAFHNPEYFPSPEAWREFRILTRLAAARADRLVFSSGHTRDDAVAQELVDPSRASVVALGADHAVAGTNGPPGTRPAGTRDLGDGAPAILCLGTDYQHKNRVFALRLLERLRTRHGWDGVLVLAGSSVAHGSSRPRETRMIESHLPLVGHVLDLGPVSEAEKRWLFERSALVVYPSVLEGFGLVPFEAAAHGVPCLWAAGSSLGELLPSDAAGIVRWDEEQSAERALALIGDKDERSRNLSAIRAAASRLTWDTTAANLIGLYEATCVAPPAIGRTVGAAQAPIGEDAMRLVGPGGELPADVHRPLLALATHPRLATPVFAALRLGYRVSYELRRRRG
jgi:glycosyltransferase involved in cell wall biosynthesis